MTVSPTKNPSIKQTNPQTAKESPIFIAMRTIQANQEQLEQVTTPTHLFQEKMEQLVRPVKLIQDNLERITQAIANPFGESITPSKSTPVIIEHEPLTFNPQNSPALRTLNKQATTQDNESIESLKTEKQILLKVIERLTEKLTEKPLEKQIELVDIPAIANTLALQSGEIVSLKAQLEQKTQEISKLQAEIDQLQATATPATKSNDGELPTRTANNAGKIISALAVELLGLDITQHYGEANEKIRTAIELQGNTLSDDTVAKWLKIAHEMSK